MAEQFVTSTSENPWPKTITLYLLQCMNERGLFMMPD